MIIHLHASCWNEERMLPFFFKYYDPIVDHYFIHDNQSSDHSLEILASHPRVTVLPLVLEGNSICEAAFQQINSLWEISRGQADWVTVCNIDELFWHVDLRWYLKRCKKTGITFLPSIGYQMVSDRFPEPEENLALTVRNGTRDPAYDKPSFFNPSAITNSGFAMARHTATPEGHIVYPEHNEILLLHYKYLGLDYVTARHAELNARRREMDIQNRLGFQYDPDYTVKHFQAIKTATNEIVPPKQALVAKLIYRCKNTPLWRLR
jgi:hypothetical protein